MLRWAFNILLLGFLVAVIGAAGVVWTLLPGLPSVDSLREVKLQVPMRVYTRDGKLIGEFGEKRRIPVKLANVPPLVIHAFLDAEDDRFYQHPGVDWQGLVRAGIRVVQEGELSQGGSTITMQLARNLFLTPEKKIIRKVREILLALEIEHEFSKDKILELYLNLVFLGQRAYGVGAAAEVYYGTDLQHLTIAQVAMIAGLPQAPSALNPVRSPARARVRRAYVLRRLLEKGHITQVQYKEAMASPVATYVHALPIQVEAPDVAEMVRTEMNSRYGEEAATTSGFRVYTTLDSKLQDDANLALRKALIDYDRRHGYRGPEKHVNLPEGAGQTQWVDAIKDLDPVGGLDPAVVVKVADRSVQVWTQGDGLVTVDWSGLSWARSYINRNARGPAPKTAGDILKVGDIIRLQRIGPDDAEGGKPAPTAGGDTDDGKAGWKLAEIPAVQGALVSLAPDDGAIRALVGGFDFSTSQFNRVTQAFRQPGSNIKPFIYSAALDSGFTPASIINDAPIVFDAPGLDSTWRPENYAGKYVGPTRLREALTESRNLVSIRILRAIGIDYAINYLKRFGFDENRLPHNLSLALGTPTLSPLEIANGYAIFANGGYKVSSYFIDHIEGSDGKMIMQSQPDRVCRDCDAAATTAAAAVSGAPTSTATGGAATAVPTAAPDQGEDNHIAKRVIGARNCWLMTSIMRDVIRYGTGRRAKVLNRTDLAGKTGTTNEQKDAWFSGFNAKLETTVWVGFDQVQPLGRYETGAHAALPAWIEYMRRALDDSPEAILPQPPGLVTVKIDPSTGLLAGANDPNAIFETFRANQVPQASPSGGSGYAGGASHGGAREQLF
jgi:penicillin-binding protein 1A